MIDRSSTSRCSASRGVTLIEMIVLITLSAVLTGIVIAGINGIYRFNRALAQHDQIQLALRQFEMALRSDIRHAETCQWDDDKQTLRFELGEDRLLRYSVEKKRWVRTETDEEGMTTAFGLDDSFVGECLAGQVRRAELLRIAFTNEAAVKSAEKTAAVRPQRCVIVAQVGRDLHDQENSER